MVGLVRDHGQGVELPRPGGGRHHDDPDGQRECDRPSTVLGEAGTDLSAPQIRYGFIVILAMMLLSLPILLMVDMNEGRRAAEAYEQGSARVALAGEEEG